MDFFSMFKCSSQLINNERTNFAINSLLYITPSLYAPNKNQWLKLELRKLHYGRPPRSLIEGEGRELKMFDN